jgi:C1A family cysteine protease
MNLAQGAFTEFNWKYANPSLLSSVKDQGKCGNSYAFAVVGAVEAAMAFETGKQTDLSVQQVMDCSSDTNQMHETNLFCNGGNLQSTWNYVSGTS